MNRFSWLALALVLVVGPQPVWADSPRDETQPAFGGLAAADTLRTNLWLVQALMTDLVAQTLTALPPPPARISLHPQASGISSEILGSIVAETLEEEGYELYLEELFTAEPDSNLEQPEPRPAGPIDYEYRYKVADIELLYPEAKRRFGIWRQWVDRELNLSAMITIVDRRSGRLLLADQLQRSYRDRVASDDFDLVRSDTYDFTDATLEESGWRRRIEEIVVLGTLTGLIAVYFANTGE